jgi:hypothetical protein
MGKLKNKKVMPTLNRPSIDLDRTTSPREWKHVRADEVTEGDLVANLGSVIYTQATCRGEVMIEAGVPQFREYFFPEEEMLYAFVKKEN